MSLILPAPPHKMKHAQYQPLSRLDNLAVERQGVDRQLHGKDFILPTKDKPLPIGNKEQVRSATGGPHLKYGTYFVQAAQ